MRRLPVLIALTLAVAVATGRLDATQTVDETTRLAALGKAWGLLKYFHPDVATGTVDWDQALVDAIPRMRSASTFAEVNDEVMRLIRAAGPSPRLLDGANMAAPESDAAFAWIEDRGLFDSATLGALKSVRLARVASTNRYVRAGPSNPEFGSEAAYDLPVYPSDAMRLLALFRYWNMIQYYAPNRDITDRPWRDVLSEFIPRFIEAADANAYHLLICELTASIDDTHASTSSATITSYWGPYAAPVRTRYIESQTVVTRVFDRLAGNPDLRAGDAIVDIGGVATATLRERMRKYINASNEGSRQRNIDSLLLRTRSTSPLVLGITRGGSRRTVNVPPQLVSTIFNEEANLDASLPRWQILDSNIGYVHMGRLTQADVPAMRAALNNTRGIVFDVRNYPQGTMYLIAEWLNPESRPFAKFTRPRYDSPGTMEWTAPYSAGPSRPSTGYYRGRVIMLGDDRTQSHAEFTMMALKTAPDVTIIGTPTSGADGNVSLLALPGGVRTYFSGLGVYYPDGGPTQRVGIVPDIEMTPTIAGIRAGTDELLQRALQVAVQ